MALTTITNSMVSVNAIQGTLIADNAITAVHIATNAVSGTLVADNAITAVHIAQNVITVTQLADDAVEADKIADGVITTNHLNSAMISSQSAVTANSSDYVLIGDSSDSNALKKALVSDFGASLANDGNNRVITGTGSGLNGEANLTFDGSALQVTGTVTVGVNDTGHDVKFFGATSGKYMLWDESADQLKVAGSIATADLILSNESHEANDFDGTTGSWQIQEGSDDLFIMNKLTGKKYKFKLEEI